MYNCLNSYDTAIAQLCGNLKCTVILTAVLQLHLCYNYVVVTTVLQLQLCYSCISYPNLFPDCMRDFLS